MRLPAITELNDGLNDLSGRSTIQQSATVLTVIACLLAFLVLNPFLALFLLALLCIYRPIPPAAFILPASLSFALFFYCRDYGVEWYPGSTDDVPQYIAMYQSDYGITFYDLIERFFNLPNGNELLWHIPLWGLANTLDVSAETFVFLHYLAIFCAVFLSLSSLSTRHLVPFSLVYFFFIPISINSIAFIWRQQLAFCIFLAGVGVYLVRGKKIGKWLIYVSPLMHVANIFYVAVFLAYNYIRRHNGFDNKLRVTAILIGMLVAIPFASSFAIALLDSVGLGRVMDYFIGGAGVDTLRVYLLMGVYALPQLAAFYMLRNDHANNLFMVLCLAVFSIVLALPSANGIYDRLLMFSLPLLSLYLYRCLSINFSPEWRVPALIFVFVVGVMRMYGPVNEGYGPGSFLAFGHAFDPTMGVLKMLISL